jgi:uncharacterized protein YecA (UPF0149 family)
MSESNKSVSVEVFDSQESSCTDTSCCPPKGPVVRATPKVGRNDPCICGNGRKYKKCCGKNI